MRRRRQANKTTPTPPPQRIIETRENHAHDTFVYTCDEQGHWQRQPLQAKQAHHRQQRQWASLSWLQATLISFFLPEGYPGTVSPDYLAFQVFDTIQALSSYLRGILCTQALLVGVGVGKEEATAVSAVLQWVLRDGLGMIGGMLFAWSRASSFGFDIKKWRFFADCINDVGLTLEMVSPLFEGYFLVLASLGSVCKSMCGVAAGATRAALSQHFARNNNVADISAKEGIQESCVSLLGLVLGSWFASRLGGSPHASWVAFIVLLLIHVAANYKAMRVLVLKTLNRQRAFRVLREAVESDGKVVPVPHVIAKREHIVWLARGWPSIRFGSRVQDCLRDAQHLQDCLAQMPDDAQYVLVFHDTDSIDCLLAPDTPPHEQLRALFHAFALCRFNGNATQALSFVAQHFASVLAQMETAGWRTDQVNLEANDWRVHLTD